MKQLAKSFFIFIMATILIVAPPLAYASSPAGWVQQSIVMQGANAVITAGKTGLKSVVSYAPNASKVASSLKKGGGPAAAAFAIAGILGYAVDWVLDPANNRIKYKVPVSSSDPGSTTTEYLWNQGSDYYATAEILCQSTSTGGGFTYSHSVVNGGEVSCFVTNSTGGVELSHKGYRVANPDFVSTPATPEEKYISLDAVAAKVVSNAASGHSPSQDLLKSVAAEAVTAGEVDAQLQAAAVPDTANPPDTNNPPIVPPNNPPVPFDPSSIIAAIQSLMTAINSMATSLSTQLQDLIGINTQTNEKLDEVVAQEVATQTVVNEGMDKVVAANDRTGAKVGEVVEAIESLQTGQMDGQVINDAVDRVIANDNANSAATNDAISQSADRAREGAKTNTGELTDTINESGVAVQDAISNQTEELTTADPDTGKRTLNLPDACTWAATICEFVEWATADPDVEEPEEYLPEVRDETKFDNIDISDNYINASGQCPTPEKLAIMGGSVDLSYAPLCTILEKLAPIIVACAYLSGAYIIIRGN